MVASPGLQAATVAHRERQHVERLQVLLRGGSAASSRLRALVIPLLLRRHPRVLLLGPKVLHYLQEDVCVLLPGRYLRYVSLRQRIIEERAPPVDTVGLQLLRLGQQTFTLVQDTRRQALLFEDGACDLGVKELDLWHTNVRVTALAVFLL